MFAELKTNMKHVARPSGYIIDKETGLKFYSPEFNIFLVFVIFLLYIYFE